MNKVKELDFGTYHHSTPAESEKIRETVKDMFTDVFASLPFRRRDELRILDVGCGLGFLSCLSAEFYKNARIIGIDTFKHSSLKAANPEKAKENARILGFSDRIDFKKRDLLKFRPSEKFDIIASNLVYHNLGKMRFKAYRRLLSWTREGSFVVMGELFFSPKTDLEYLAKLFGILKETKLKNDDSGKYSMLVMSKD